MTQIYSHDILEPTHTHADPAACETFHAHPDTIVRVREAMIGGHEVASLAETFRILGDATRVRMLDALSHAELCVCDLATLLDLSESAVSHQLRLLRGMRLVRPRREGRMVFYALDDQHIVGLLKHGLGHVEELPLHAAHRPAAPRDSSVSDGGGASPMSQVDEEADGSVRLRRNEE